MRRAELAGYRALADAAQIQAIVVGALMMRELHTRYGRDNLGFVWLFAEPFLFCMGVIVIWSVIHGRYEHGVPILAFVMTGYMPLTLWRHITMRSTHCFRANASLLYHRQVRMLDLLLARVLLEFYGTLIAYAVIGFIFWSVDLYELPRDWGLFYLGWAYMGLFGCGFGLILGSLTEMYEWLEKLVGPFMYFMLPICGVFFMVDWLPPRLQQAALYMPTVNAFELIRAGQLGPSVRTHYWLEYETFVCAAMIAVGLMLCRNVHRHLIVE
ncbi:MAG: capsule biosynthesis protein [Hydrocarboniphaga sp.]|uniref:ABC transporter permease n=1 Tax=Hydrocarboniphaga sp. TaxID=2033016 RepID=UPI002633D754|nr:ABC transporter permease [Hydrocarboniphaga sp.]MDB5972039.1 capsule biosynthesis protein [Hydrocarboniphaga sp.]